MQSQDFLAPSRRMALLGGAALALSACDNPPQNKAPTPPPTTSGDRNLEPTVNVAELMKDGPLPEQVLGNANAPVTIVEYASLTCSACGHFHKETSAYLKEKYIDTGKVRLIFREYPRDPLDFAAYLLARCAGEGKFFPMTDMLFRQQSTWAASSQPEAALFEVVKQAGFTRETFDACLQDQKSYSALQEVRQRALEKFGVDSTPAFFVNGRIQRGTMTPSQLDALLAPYLAAK